MTLFRKLGKIKADYPEASWGTYRELLLTNRQYAFARVGDKRTIITAVNNDDQPAHLEIGLPGPAGKAVDLLAGKESVDGTTQAEFEILGGKLVVDLPANRGIIACLSE